MDIDAVTILRGMAAGLVATGAMILIELVARLRWGLAGLLDWQINQATAARFTKRPAETLVFQGLGQHVLHGLLAGLVVGWLVPFVPAAWPALALGLGYGAVLFVVTLIAFRPVTGRRLASGDHGTAAVGVALLTHLVYGAVLALLFL